MDLWWPLTQAFNFMLAVTLIAILCYTMPAAWKNFLTAVGIEPKPTVSEYLRL